MTMWKTPNRRRTIRGRRMAHLAGSGYPMSERKAEEAGAPPEEKPKKRAAKKAAPKNRDVDE